jgi:prophage regulatory protein
MQQSQFPAGGFLRLDQVLQLYPVSKSQWWHGVKTGIYPASIKLSPKVTVWRSSDIYKLIEEAGK